jgi:hypothetical protein
MVRLITTCVIAAAAILFFLSLDAKADEPSPEVKAAFEAVEGEIDTCEEYLRFPVDFRIQMHVDYFTEFLTKAVTPPVPVDSPWMQCSTSVENLREVERRIEMGCEANPEMFEAGVAAIMRGHMQRCGIWFGPAG